MHLVRIAAAEGVREFVRELGANPLQIIEQTGLTDSQFRDPNTYIAYGRFAELLGNCAVACREPLFGLLLAERHSIAVLGDIPLIAARSATVGDALEAVNRYLYLHASGIQVGLKPRGEDMVVEFTADIGDPFGLDQMLQLSVVHVAIFVAALLDTTPHAFRLQLRQPAPAPEPSARATKFRAVEFSSGHDGITIPVAVLSRRNHQDEAALTYHLQSYLQQLKARYPDSLLEQVRDLISRLLPSGECSVDAVARTLDMHPRSLQQCLRCEGTSYRHLLRDVRLGLATRQLRAGITSVTDLAVQLGYAEVSVFSRHFKRWTGLSPKAWQRAHGRQDALVARLRDREARIPRGENRQGPAGPGR